MPESERGRYLIADAWGLQADALEMLGQGRLRNVAEKAWCATKRATDALILERTGREPTRTSQTSSGIKALGRQSVACESLWTRFRTRIQRLHSQCFYDGRCDPADFIASLVYDTADYIGDAEAAADELRRNC